MTDIDCPDCGAVIYAQIVNDAIWIGCTACPNTWNRFGKNEDVLNG